MTEEAPTMDRLFAGLMAGAAVGAVIVTAYLTVPTTITTSYLVVDMWQILFTVVVLFLVLALAMSLLQAPLWTLMRALKLRDWVAASLAGGLTFGAPVGLFALLGFDYSGAPFTAENVAMFVSWTGSGFVAGFVAWRVATFRV